MLIRTPADLGAAIRDRRRSQGLGQAALAAKVGVTRLWIIEVEKGKPRAEIGLILRTLGALGISLRIDESPATAGSGSGADIDEIVSRARRRSK